MSKSINEPGFFNAVRTVAAVLETVGSRKSLIESARATIIEPLTVLDKELEANPITTALLQSLVNQYAAFFTMAAENHLNVDKLETIRRLDRLNPSRRAIDVPVIASNLERYRQSLSMENLSAKDMLTMGTESLGMENKPGDDKLFEMINKSDALSVGKVMRLSVSPKRGGEEGEEANARTETIAVNVRTLTLAIQSTLLADIIRNKVEDVRLSSRWVKLMAKEITLTDFLLGTDRRKRRMKMKAADDSGVMDIQDDRKRKNYLKGLLTGEVSLNQISGITIVTKDTLERIEREEGFAFSNDKKRERFMDDMSTMIFVVVNTTSEVVTFYYKSLPGGSQYTFNQINASESKAAKGADITGMMRAFNEGQRPKLI